MTIEEMIERLKPYAEAYHDGYLFRSVIAALLAGQALYDAPDTDAFAQACVDWAIAVGGCK